MKRTLGLTLLLFATLFSCMRQEKPLPAELSRAESVMWEHPDSALSILRSMPQSSLSSGKNYATWALLLAQARDKVYGKRLPDSLNIPSSDELVQDAMDYFEKGSAFWSLGQLDSAKVYFQKSLETDNLYTLSEAYEVLYYICVEQKLYKEAIEYNNQYLIYSDSLQVINHAGELAEIQARYDHERLLNINNQLKLEKTNQEIIGLFVTAVLLILIIVYQYRVLRKEKSLAHAREQIRIYKESIRENENRIKENEQLIATLNNKQQEIDEIVSENKSLLDQNAESHKEIEKYEELLKSSSKKLDEQLPYFDKLKDLKEHPKYLKDADWSLIINWTNLQYHQFYTRLEKDFPDFSELDKRYCCLIKMGFSSSQIAVFANSLPESVSKQKQRIKQRIKKSKQIPSDVSFLLDQYLKEY